MKKYFETNKKHWNELADLHATTEMYGVSEFKAGKNSLRDIEINEIGNVDGKKLLHLQCHFGMDTLSLARMGAITTGIDFSERAIYHANKLSKEIGVSSRFIHCNIYQSKEKLPEPNSFDIVFTSLGAIYWLPDLKKWADIISYFLKIDGIFYILDSHPTCHIFDDESDKDLIVKYSYFHSKEPLMFESDVSYADPDAKIVNQREYGWQHSLSNIINALIEAGLQIEFLHEFPYIAWKMFPFMEKKADGWDYLPESYVKIPLMFSIRARKQ